MLSRQKQKITNHNRDFNMKLKVVQSDSQGNCYILESENSALILECGVTFRKVQKAIDYKTDKIAGCIITHEHGDHSGYAKQFAKRGVNIYGSHGTIKSLNVENFTKNEMTKLHDLDKFDRYEIGDEFKIFPFDVRHDSEEPFGYIINHPEAGNILFAVDTFYIPYSFDDIHYIIIEANYRQSILDQNVKDGELHPIVRSKVIESHMEIETLKRFLAACNLENLKKTILFHLSKKNSSGNFAKEVSGITGKPTHIAKRNTEFELKDF